jgi:murein DD-endopeptidase MepM/ murein hydrolase activator NlpD
VSLVQRPATAPAAVWDDALAARTVATSVRAAAPAIAATADQRGTTVSRDYQRRAPEARTTTADADPARARADSRDRTSRSSARSAKTSRPARSAGPVSAARRSDRQALAAAEVQATRRDAAIAEVEDDAEAYAAALVARAWTLPLASGSYRLTASFGMSGSLWSSDHTGLDFAAPSGTPLVAVASGVVTETGYAGAYGNQTILTLEDGTEVWYCHQTSIAVSPGQQVASGQVIGSVGSTGNTTGPHLHLEVRPGGGDPVDPYSSLVAQGLNP